MTVTRILGSFGVATLGVLALAACEPATSTSPIIGNTGTVENTLRQQQLQNIQSGANQGTQNAPVTSVSPGVGGIERAPGGATAGSVAAGGVNAVQVNPGAGGIVRQGVGAPETGVRRPAPGATSSR